jgi:phage gp36-like protein
MAYATAKDFIAKFGEIETAQITDLENEGDLNSKTLTVALSDASDELNTYLSGRYTLPLPDTVVIKPLSRACCDIARYYLYKDRPTEEVAKRYENTIKWLKDVAAHRANLVFEPSLLPEVEKSIVGPVVAVGSNTGAIFSDARFTQMPGVPW